MRSAIRCFMDTKRFTNTSVPPHLSQLFARQAQAWPGLPPKAGVDSASWRVSLLPKASWPHHRCQADAWAAPSERWFLWAGGGWGLGRLRKLPGGFWEWTALHVALSMWYKLIWFVMTFYFEIMPNLQRGFKNFILKTSQIPSTRFTNCSRFVSLLNISFLFLI